MEESNRTNYEELYPTVANYGEIYPQAALTEHKDVDSRYPMAVEKTNLYNSPPPLPGTHNKDQSPSSLVKHDTFQETPLPLRPKKILGLRRRTFLLVCAIIIAAVIGAVVGGVVGSNSSKKNNTSGSSSGSSSNPTATSPVQTSASSLGVATATVGGTVPTSSAINIHSIAASVTINGGVNFTSIAYQNSSSWNILYRFNSGNGTYGDAKLMSLPDTPIEKTPLAATSNAENLGITVNVFYIDNNFQITNVNISCSVDTNYDCFLTNVTEISRSLTTGISEQTSLAAEYLGSSLGWRVFYHDKNNMLSVISLPPGTLNWDKGTIIGLEALPGSSIASTLEPISGNLTVFYIRNDGGAIDTVIWDAGTSKWLNSTQLSTTSAPNFTSSSGALAATAQSGLGEDSRLYYVGTDKQIYEYTTTSTINSNWTTTPDQSPEWALNDETTGRIAAIGWNDQVRIYYQSGGEVVENALSGDVWTGVSGV